MVTRTGSTGLYSPIPVALSSEETIVDILQSKSQSGLLSRVPSIAPISAHLSLHLFSIIFSILTHCCSKNLQSNSIVVYDSETNRFELLSLDGYNGKQGLGSRDRRHSHQHESRGPGFSAGGDLQFVCANCGYVNRISSRFPQRGKGERRNSHSPFSQPESDNLHDLVISSGENSSDATLRLEDESGKRSYAEVEPRAIGTRKRRKSTDVGTDRHAGKASYITTSSGDLLRGDYFRLLAQIDWPNKPSSRGFVKKAIAGAQEQPDGDSDENENEGSDYHNTKNSIPYQLINQGYFKKFFKVLQTLGHGSNGVVYKVEHELMGLNLGVFALKKIAIGDNVPNLLKILNEVQFLYNLSDKAYGAISESGSGNIVRYNHVWLEIDQVTKFGPKVPVIFILYEYCGGGDLEQFVSSVANPHFDIKREKMRRKLRRLSESKARSKSQNPKILDEAKYRQQNARYLNNFEIFKIFNDAINGVAYLHRLKIIHRDLKPSNCLFKSSFPPDYQPITSISELNRIPTLLVSDFGESIMENTHRTSTGTTGTLEFCAPELFQLDKQQGSHKLKEFTHSSDIYSLGMILYYLCFNDLPFRSSSPNDIRKEILECRSFDGMDKIRPLCARRGETKSDNWLLFDWVSLIRQMTDPDREKRPSAPQIASVMKHIYRKLAEDENESLMEMCDDSDDPSEDDNDTNGNGSSRNGINESDENEKAGPLNVKTVHNKNMEVVALINDTEKPAVAVEKWHLQFLLLVAITVANIWLWRNRPYLVNVEYLALGVSLNPGVQHYLLIMQILIFASGLGLTFSGRN